MISWSQEVYAPDKYQDFCQGVKQTSLTSVTRKEIVLKPLGIEMKLTETWTLMISLLSHCNFLSVDITTYFILKNIDDIE